MEKPASSSAVPLLYFPSRRILCAVAAFVLVSLRASAAPEISVALHEPCNLFNAGDPVKFEGKVKEAPEGGLPLTATVTDFFGKEVWKGSVPVSAAVRGAAPFVVDIGILPLGYYQLKLDADAASGSVATFGVVRFVNRSREEVLKGDYRFGLKFGGGNRNFDSYKAMDVAARLGLTWTRTRFNQDIDKLNALPVRIIYKVEQFPAEAYDEARYGPKEKFKLRHFGWQKASVPLEVPYKKWLREEIAKIPPEHNVYEIWNEPWGKVSPQEFAKVAQWTKDVILEVHPKAVVGPNLGTHYEYDSEFIAAGGMEGMEALLLHPYSHPERGAVRAKVRGVREFYEKRLGRPIQLFATEYGSPSPPAGERADSKEEYVAAWNVRRSLIFYAENFKGFMPHILAQSEKDPSDKEDWYGHFRANMQPKPVLLSHVTAARLIDGSRYVGDLFLKPDVGAMLFEREGKYTLALWTNDQTIPVRLAVGVPEVMMVDLVGKETEVATKSGELDLELTGNMTYLLGVSPDLEKLASKLPYENQWVEGLFVRKTRQARRMAQAPNIDGQVAQREWNGQTQLEIKHSKVDAQDGSAVGYVAWDRKFLYIAAVIKDSDTGATADPSTGDFRKDNHNPEVPHRTDAFEIFVGSQPKYQVPEFLFAHDSRLFFSPDFRTNQHLHGEVDQMTKSLTSVEGMKVAYKKTSDGWEMEAAIPLTSFREFPMEPGARISFEMRLNDADTGKSEIRFVNPVDADPKFYDDATHWSYLELLEK